MKTNSDLSLNKKIVSTFILITIIPLFLFSLIYLVNLYQFQYKNLKVHNERILTLIADNVESNLAHFEEDLYAVSEMLNYNSEAGVERTKVLKNLIKTYKHFLTFQFANFEGIVTDVFPYDENIAGIDVSRQEYYFKTKEGQSTYWSSTYISMQLNQAVVSLNIPYDDGVLSAVISLDEIADVIKQLQIGKRSYMAMLDQNGYYIAHTSHAKVLQREHMVMDRIKKKSSNLYRDGPYEMFFLPIGHTYWSVLIAQHQHEAYYVIYRDILISLIMLMIVSALVLLFAKRQASDLNNIISSLMSRIRQVASGDYLIEDQKEKYHELQELKTGINQMVKAILQRQAALHESHEKYRALYWEANEAFMIVSPSEGFISANPATLRLFDYENEDEFLMQDPDSISPQFQSDGQLSADKAQQVMKKALDLGSNSFEWIHKRKNGELFNASVFLTKVYYGNRDVLYAIVRDITETKKMRELMVQTEKMMSIGELAAGMAHEINNPLAVILQSTQNIKRRLDKRVAANIEAARKCDLDLDNLNAYFDERKINLFIDGITEVGNRAAEIVTNMLQFSRKSDSSRSVCSVEQIINDTLVLAEKDYDLDSKYDFRHFTIRKDIKKGLYVNCIKTEIEQVIFNLLKNSAQAMAELDKIKEPTINIKSYQDSAWTVMEISDNGPGLDDELQKRVFEPFFTTKPVGVGTGLGLSVSYFIITQNHSGVMLLESQKGRGTRFIIKLPLVR